jgi:tRNA A-37 threonylcarbamoyl transferase component Bud32
VTPVGDPRVVAGRYELIRPLGRGGMGAVWLGEDKLAGRQVAVKELRSPDGVTDDERDVFRKRALQEARSAARLAHPNAVTLHDIVPATADDDAVYLVMEFVDGATLAQLVQRGGPLRPERAAGVALQLLSILEAAHSLGIVHRDIKPSNIMVTANGQVKLTDFGIAHMVGGTRLTGSGVIGTPAYMAPEQIQGQGITPAVDLWALGVTLFDVTEGHNPFDRETTVATFHAILMAELPVPACPPPLGTVITGLLVRDPGQRITVAQARQLLAGGAGWAGPSPVVGASGAGAHLPGTGVGVPGPATQPGSPAFAGHATQPGNPGYLEGRGHPVTVAAGKPVRGRRAAVVAGVGAAAVAAIVAIALTVLHPGSSGTPSARSSTSDSVLSTGTASASPVSTANTPAGSAGGSVPKAYLGRWQGTLTDNTGLEGPQAAQLSITGGPVNSVVGSVSYPTIGCTYEFHLVSAQAGQVTLFERVQSGLCVSEYVVLAPGGGGLTESVYPAPPSGGRPDFFGHLSRTG